MDSSIKDRMSQYIEYKNISDYRLEKDLGLSKGYWNKSKNPSADIIRRFSCLYSDISADWLLRGEGNMLREEKGVSDPSIIPTASSKSTEDLSLVVNYERKGSPYYNVDFIGGFDVLVNDQTRTPDYYIDFEPYNRDGVIWCNISGHSMEPEINNGDFIALRKIEDWQNFLTMGEIYAIITTNGLRTVKRVRKGGSPDSYTLVPSNKDYDEQEIEKKMIMAIFEVMGGVKKF